MIEVKAKIFQRSVFIAGECLECELMITNHGRTKKADENKFTNNRRNSESCTYDPETWSRTNDVNKIVKDESVTLAWASAQVYCHCNINERQLKLPVNLQNRIKQEHITKFTSFSPVMGKGFFNMSNITLIFLWHCITYDNIALISKITLHWFDKIALHLFWSDNIALICSDNIALICSGNIAFICSGDIALISSGDIALISSGDIALIYMVTLVALLIAWTKWVFVHCSCAGP